MKIKCSFFKAVIFLAILTVSIAISPKAMAAAPQGCADLNADGIINYIDVGIAGSVFNTCNDNANFNAKNDINGDGCVNQKDVDILNVRYGQTTTCAQAAVCPDIDADGVVNYKELGRIGAVFNTCSGSVNYNSTADLNGDNCVDNGDLLIVDKYFNKSASTIDKCAVNKLVKVLSPNGGEQWQIGKANNITWSSTGYDKVRLYVECDSSTSNLSYSSGAIMDVPSGATGGTYSYTVPANWTPLIYCKVQVTENVTMLIKPTPGVNFDDSDTFFSIVNPTTSILPSVKVLSPNGGEKWVRGNTYDINWTSNIENGTFSIEATAMSAKGFGTIVQGVMGKDGKYSWTIPKDFGVGYTDLNILPTKIRIYNSKDPNIYDESDSDLSIISSPTPGSCILPNGTLVKLPGDPKIYIIKDCKKVWIQTAEEFISSGYKWSDVTEVSSNTVGSIPDTNVIPTANIPEGSIIQATGDPDVYIVKYVGSKKFKRLILSPSVFKSYGHLKWENIIKVDQATLDSFTTSNLVKSENGSIYKLVPNGDTGLRNHIKDMIAFQRLALDMDAVYQINTVDENSYTQGQELQ